MNDPCDDQVTDAASVADPVRWLSHLGDEAAADLRRIINASTGSTRDSAVRLARAHGRGWGNIAIALALARDSFAPLDKSGGVRAGAARS